MMSSRAAIALSYEISGLGFASANTIGSAAMLAHHFLRQHVGYRQAEEYVGAPERFGQRGNVAVGRELRLGGAEIRPAVVNDALAVST